MIEQNEVVINKTIKIKYTISVGISKIENEDNSIEVAVNKADMLLYKAKKLGKNKVAFD